MSHERQAMVHRSQKFITKSETMAKIPEYFYFLTKELFALRLYKQVFHNATTYHIYCFMRDGWIIIGPSDVTSVHQELEMVYHTISSS